MPIGASTVASVKKNLLLDRKIIAPESLRIWTTFDGAFKVPWGHITSPGSQKTGNSNYLDAWCRVLNQRFVLKIVLAAHFLANLQFWKNMVGI